MDEGLIDRQHHPIKSLHDIHQISHIRDFERRFSFIMIKISVFDTAVTLMILTLLK
jgi:hypothetical protein